MFQSQALCSAPYFPASPRRASPAIEPGLIGRRLLPIVTAGALLAAVATVPHGAAPVSSPAFANTVIVRDASVTALRDKVEAMRAQLRHLPGVGAVTITGLHQQGLAVDYNARHLAGFGLTPDDLAASVPSDQAQSRPGHLVLQATAEGDVQAVANLPVRAGRQVFRLGDVAMVLRAPLNTPVSTMRVEGQPAARLHLVPIR